MNVIIDKQIFNQNLLLTQTYCELQLNKLDTNTASVLRSFNPEYKGKPLFSFLNYSAFGRPYSSVVWIADSIMGDNLDLYSELFDMQLLHKQQTTKGEVSMCAEDKGKILVVEIDSVIPDGVSQEESDGFIDYNDCPPVDTWFYIIRNERGDRILFAWIPEVYVSLVNLAMEVNALDIFGWYDGNSSRLYYGDEPAKI